MRRRRRQRGGAYRPRGLVNRGSGRIDPSTGNLRLPVDDVPALLGKNEFVVNAGAVRKVGSRFLHNINNLGLEPGSSPIKPNTLGYGSKYQRGGSVNRRRFQGGSVHNPIIKVDLNARSGEFIYRNSRLPYQGPYHIHADGTYMIGRGQMGATHDVIPSEVIIKTYKDSSKLHKVIRKNRWQNLKMRR